MRAVDRLLLSSRIPPRIHDEDIIRLRQGQARPTRLERNEEHRCLTRTEALNNLRPVAGRAIQLHNRHATPLQHVPNTRQERRELAENQRTVAQRHDLVEAVRHVLHLRRPHMHIGLLHQGRVERELTQPRDRRQNAHVIRVRIHQQIEDAGALAGQILVVDVAMFLAQVDAHDVDDLVGQIGGHLFLRAPQDKGRNVGGQAREHVGISTLDGPAYLLGEGLPRGQ